MSDMTFSSTGVNGACFKKCKNRGDTCADCFRWNKYEPINGDLSEYGVD